MISMSLREVARAIGVKFVLAGHWGGHDPLKPGFPGPDTAAASVRRISTDSRDIAAGDLFFALRGKNHDGHRFIGEVAAGGAVACIADADGAALLGGQRPTQTGSAGGGLAAPVLVVDDTVAALGRLAAHYRRSVMRVGTTVIAVTGSNGKTTTKGMIHHVLRQTLQGVASPKSFNNQIGVPLTILSVGSEDRYVVAEIGTNAPGEIAALSDMVQPHVGVITSIGEAHLEGLGGIPGVAAEKAAILERILPSGLAVVNIDRPEILPYVRRCRNVRVVTVGTNPEAKLTVSGARSSLCSTQFELEGRHCIELPMPGAHHATNAAAAFAVARWLGLDCSEIIEAFRTFVPADGRTRRIEANGMTIIDDAYNANPASVLAAVEALCAGTASKGTASPGARRVFVFGDMLELGAGAGNLHGDVVRAIVESGIEVLVGVGRAVGAAAAELNGRGMEVHLCEDTDEACRVVPDVVQAGDAVWIKGSRAMALDRLVGVLSDGEGQRSSLSYANPNVAAVA